MPDSFSLKTIQIAITLGDGSFSGGGSTKTIEGLGCDVTVEKPGLPEKNSATAKIWGLSLHDMQQLTMLSFKPLESNLNTIAIKAGEKDKTLPLIFQGEIVSAFADFNSAPDICMEFEARTGSFPNQQAQSSSTIDGEVPADQLFSQFASEAGYAYRNEGISASVRNVWYPGSPITKLQKLARDIGCELLIDDGEVVVMPAGSARSGNPVLLSKETGLIGYPTFNQDGISCRCLFNPDLAYGGLIKVVSLAPKASGMWRITKLSHSLSAYKPGGGDWQSELEASPME